MYEVGNKKNRNPSQDGPGAEPLAAGQSYRGYEYIKILIQEATQS